MTEMVPLESMLSLRGRVALVTGASGGIGSAVVARLREASARVIGCDRPGAPASAADVHLTCDLSDATAISRMFEDSETFDRLDMLVHCAGIRRDAVVWKLDDAAWQDVMRINLDSAFHLIRHTAPLMRRDGGAVVLVSSINGERGKFGQANYAASKAGLIGLGRTAAKEMGRFGVRVNMVAPGLIRTPMTASLPEQFLNEGIHEAALGRLGEADDVASVILFLCTGLSRHVTGQVIRVDGGQLMA